MYCITETVSVAFPKFVKQIGLQVNIISCVCSFGAAVVVVTGNINISEGYTRNFYNPMCFLQYNDSSTSPSDINNSKVWYVRVYVLWINRNVCT